MTTTPSPMTTEAIDELRAALRGPVIGPDDAAYDMHRSVWNAMIDRRPSAIASPTVTADVATAVRFAVERGIALCVKGGGHNVAGLAVADGALMLDLHRMKDVDVDPGARIATAQAGCVLGDVDRETQAHGLAAVLGFVSETGIAGLTLGGGFGYLTRKYGWTVDNLRSVELVTADGSVVRVSADSDPDLFWGLSGGGSNFGIATSFTYDLYPVGPEIVGGAMAFPGEDAREVLAFFKEFAETAPEELTCVAGIRRAPPAPWIDAAYHGKLITLVVACYSGSPDEGERIVAPLKAFGSPVGDVLIRRPYAQQQALLDATQPKGRRYYWKSEYLPALDDGLFDALIERTREIPSPHSAVLLFQLGGKIQRIANDANAAGNRDARWVLNVAGSWENPEDDATNVAWAREVHDAGRPFSTGGVYVNFLTEDEGDERTLAAYGDNLPRLRELKARYDPNNVFRTNKNVTPANGS